MAVRPEPSLEMAKQQPTPRLFSPPQPSPSPATAQSGYALPPNKRVRTDGPSSQPGSPYAASAYAASPGTAPTPPTNAAFPTYSPTPPLPTGHATAPYTNGSASVASSLPDTRTFSLPSALTAQSAQTLAPQYTTATMAPIDPSTASPAPLANVMGPPQRPAEKLSKEYEYDVTDSLAGTGIDLRAEEQFMSELYSSTLDAGSDTRTGLAHMPGGKYLLHGTTTSSQPSNAATTQSHDQLAAKAASQAWNESSMRLAIHRTQEINDPFLLVAILHRRADKIAREHSIGLNLEMKQAGLTALKTRSPDQLPVPKVTVHTETRPDSTTVQMTGSFIPHDSYLVDQLALMSIATKYRLRELVEEANDVASHRQRTSHGVIPEEWEVAAAPMNMEPLEPMDTTGASAEVGGANEACPSSPKRSADHAKLEEDGAAPAKKMTKIASHMTMTMRERARQEQEWEEARLRKRQRRKEGSSDTAAASSRSGTLAPGTPGSVAPELEKPMTKKELKKTQALKAAEASSHANQNLTSSMFAGLGGKGGLFGKKKTGKAYDWMNVDRSGSGASTPSRATAGTKGAESPIGSGVIANHPLTIEGRNRLGTWREDKEKGKGIQLRDWVAILERDGREPETLFRAYMKLDTSHPK